MKKDKAASIVEIAEMLGLGRRRVEQLVHDGVIPSGADLPVAVQSYIGWLKRESSTTLAEERRRKVVIERRLLELALAEKEGTLVDPSDYLRMTTQSLAAISQIIAGCADIPEDRKRAILFELRDAGKTAAERFLRKHGVRVYEDEKAKCESKARRVRAQRSVDAK